MAALRAAAPDLYAAIPEAVWRQAWIVEVQPAGTGESVVRYLARYVKRTAISHERIVRADEFLRRYLRHVPPPGQHRVRYFGWLHPNAKRRRAIVETLLAVVLVVRAPPDHARPWHLRCPHCQAFALVSIGVIARGARDPP